MDFGTAEWVLLSTAPQMAVVSWNPEGTTIQKKHDQRLRLFIHKNAMCVYIYLLIVRMEISFQDTIKVCCELSKGSLL